MRTRRNAAVLAVSLAGHLALLAAWISTRPDLRLAEPPTLQVQLVRLPPKPKPQRLRPTEAAIRPRPAPARPSEPPDQPIPVPPAPPAPPTSLMLPDGRPWIAPSAGGLRRLERAARQPPCKPVEDHSQRQGPPCPVGSPEEAAAGYDAEKDSVNAELLPEGRYKRANKRYHELEGTAGYPGIICAVFHRC